MPVARDYSRQTLEAYEKGVVKGDFYPTYFGVEVTRHCNLACTMCPHPSFNKNDKGHMEMPLFREVIKKISPYAEIIKLHWIGEPLMHPQIVEMVELARDASNAQLYMSTNASFLSGDLAESIRKSRLDKLIISLDADTAKSYEDIRVRGKFDIVLGNIDRFLSAVERDGGPVCHIKLIQQKSNEQDVKGFRKRWSKYSSAMVEVMWLSNWAGNIDDNSIRTHLVNPNSEIERIACSDIWFKMQIDWRGRVALCCFDAFGTKVFGNLATASLSEIWHNDAIVNQRRLQIAKRYEGICARCRDWATPTEYEFWYEKELLRSDPSTIWHQHLSHSKEKTA